MTKRPAAFSPGLLALAWLAVAPAAARATTFAVTNLVTDDQGANAAQTVDADLVNAWGTSYSTTGPFWISNNGTGLSTLYSVDPATNATSKLGLVVTIPGDGTVTGQVFDTGAGAGAFNGNSFLFANEDGTISGWRGALGSNAEVLRTADPANAYKGLALATTGGHTYLYAANFAAGQVDVLKGDIGAPALTGSFADPNLPAGYAPFNVQDLGGTLFVSYAVVGPGGGDLPGLGHGIVDAFDLQGNLLARVASGGALNSPWGLAIAPASFGGFAGDLLVGNSGDGRIHAYDLGTNALVGPLTDASSAPIVIDGLRGLSPGNGGSAGDTQSIYFTAGPDGGSHGLFGVVAVPEPDTLALLASGLASLLWMGPGRTH